MAMDCAKLRRRAGDRVCCRTFHAAAVHGDCAHRHRAAGGTDVRSATTAVSPIYLESLKTYESFAASDTLFAKAAAKLDLRALFRGGAIESIEKRVLKVGIVRNTRILEISATLPEPRKAQGLAQFIAESTVAMNRSLSNKDDQDLIQGLAAQETDTRAKLQQADSAWERVLAAEPVEALQSAMENSATCAQSWRNSYSARKSR